MSISRTSPFPAGAALLSLALLCAALFLLDLFLGSVHIPLPDIIRILSGREGAREVWTPIVLDARLPRALTALLAGMALPVCGLMMQTLFRNPVAGPFILGISSGASLGVALLLLASGGAGWVLFSPLKAGGALGLILASTLGGAVVLLLVLAVSSRVSDVMTLLILGLMFGSLVSAIVGILQYFGEREALREFIRWTFGSLSGVTWIQLRVLSPVIVVSLAAAWLLSKSLNAFLLGEAQAASLGVGVRRVRMAVIALTGMLAGSITAFCGPIAFIGIAVPHLARMIFDRSDHALLIPATALIGAAVLLLCDLVAQAPWASYSLPVNAVTSLVGAPAVMLIVLRNRNLRHYF